jgi:hypothetical protein
VGLGRGTLERYRSTGRVENCRVRRGCAAHRMLVGPRGGD